MIRKAIAALVFTVALSCFVPNAHAQRNRGPRVESPDVDAARRITFRLLAPKAEKVRLSGSDIPDVGRGVDMTKGAEGVWDVTVGPLEAGAYRYRFDVDGIPVMDPRNPLTSESNANSWSLVYVPGSSVMDTRDVPHGAVAEITYFSKSLKRFRRAHVYTPPGYESGSDKYPIFYLLHGAFDCDDSWTSVGRAGFILDNLIADGKAVPMVVVMPDGHTGAFSFGRRGGRRVNEFVEDFLRDLMPHVERTYRVRADASIVRSRGSPWAECRRWILPFHIWRRSPISVFSVPVSSESIANVATSPLGKKETRALSKPSSPRRD